MLLSGFTGQISLGHAAFVARGAYTHTLLLTAGVPFVFSIVLAGLVAGNPVERNGRCIGLYKLHRVTSTNGEALPVDNRFLRGLMDGGELWGVLHYGGATTNYRATTGALG